MSTTLNTSHISVPGVATMLEHLTQSNPHPQYTRTQDLASYFKNNIFLSDIADVHLTNALPSKSLLMYNGMGSWVNIPAEDLLVQISAAYATTSTAGVVSLCTSDAVLDITNSTAAVTPNVINRWGSAKQVVSSGNFYPMLAAILQNPELPFPVTLERVQNVNVTSPAEGQALLITSYNAQTGSTTWGNVSLSGTIANTSTLGMVRIATASEVISGTSSSWESMDAAGHVVPSLGALTALTGVRYVSRVASGTTKVYESINGAGVDGEGTTGSNVSTIINTNGFVASHNITGGVVSAARGNVYGVTITAGSMIASCGVVVTNAVLSAGAITAVGANLVNTVVSTTAATVTLQDGASACAIRTVGTVSCNAGAIMAHGEINQSGSAVVGSGASAFDVAVESSGTLIVSNGGVAENIMVASGGSCVVMTSGVVRRLQLHPGARLEVATGGVVDGYVKYGSGVVLANAGATMVRLSEKETDRLVYSNATGSNISSSVVMITACQQPTGLRKVTIDGTTVSHAFVPMTPATRVPSNMDPDYNDYTLNASSTTIQDDITSGRTNVQWYVTF